jgi:hypothetical protein
MVHCPSTSRSLLLSKELAAKRRYQVR